MRTYFFRASCATAVGAMVHLQALAQVPPAAPFTYQGRLTSNSYVVNRACDFEFRLFSAMTEGTQIGPTIPVSSLSVEEGLFSVPLNFGAGAFDGSQRWLEIAVRQAGGSAFTTLTPRQPVTAAPYAGYAITTPWHGISDMPAGFADGVDDVGIGLSLPYSETTVVNHPLAAFKIDNDGTGRALEVSTSGPIAIRAAAPGNGLALLGIGSILGSTGSPNDGDAGVKGEATNSAGITYGVHGTTMSSANTSAGVYGRNLSGQGRTFGVYGYNASDGYGSAGVFGFSDSTIGVTSGVEGRTRSSEVGAAGVFGWASQQIGLAHGVYGITSSQTDGAAAVYGYASAGVGRTYGVVGNTGSATEDAAGVFGVATSPSAPIRNYGVQGVSHSMNLYSAGVYGYVDRGQASGVLGRSDATTQGTAGVWGWYTAANPTGSTYGVYAQNDSSRATARGVIGYATNMNAIGATYGTQGISSSPFPNSAGVTGLANNTGDVQTYGVWGQSLSMAANGSGVRAQGNGVDSPGNPRAAALEVRNGAIRVSGSLRPAGSLCIDAVPWEPMDAGLQSIQCPSDNDPSHGHGIGYYADILLVNPLIVAGGCNVGSIITATVETTATPPPGTSYYVQVLNKQQGNCTFRVTRMGTVACIPTTPDEPLRIHYVIINPAPIGQFTSDDADIDLPEPRAVDESATTE